MFVASDIPAILAHTRDVVILEDDEVAVVTADGGRADRTLDGEPRQRAPRPDPLGSDHGARRAATGTSCSRRCYEQPRAIADTFRGRVAPETGNVVLPDVEPRPATASRAIAARASSSPAAPSYHAALLGRAHDRAAGRHPVPRSTSASEFRYRDAWSAPRRWSSRSPSRARPRDTLGAVKAARPEGCPILAITNVVGSALVARGDGRRSTCTPAPRSAWRRPRRSPTMIVAHATCSALWLGRAARRHHRRGRDASASHDLASRSRACVEKTLELDGQIARARPRPRARARLPLPRARRSSSRSRWRARSSSRRSPTSTPRATPPAR